MPNTFELISTVTVGAGGSTIIEFTSIPNTFTDLQILVSVRGSNNIGTTGLNMRYNSTTTNYAYRRIDGSGTTVDGSAAGIPSIAILQGGNATSNTFGNYNIYIPNYAGNTFKSSSSESVNENNGTTEYMSLYAHLWSDTAAINSIQLVAGGGTLVQYSSASLYGIKNS